MRLFLFFVLIFLGIFTWGFFSIQKKFPDVRLLKTQYPAVQYRGPKLRPRVKVVKHKPAHWVGLSQISKEAIGAILVSEDWAFYNHKGFDLNQIQESMEKNIRLGRYARGGSTITQQVAKNIYLNSEKSLVRKIRELILAMDLENHLGKKKILELYLNIAEFGEGLYGIAPASQYYFKKSPSQLTPREGAFLAMLLPSPKKYSGSFRKKELSIFAKRTMNSILEKMVRANYLAEADLARSKGERLIFEETFASDTALNAEDQDEGSADDDSEDNEDSDEVDDTNDATTGTGLNREPSSDGKANLASAH